MTQFFTSGGQSIGDSASASVLPVNSNEFFRIDSFDLLAVQRILKSLLQHHSSKASILQHSAFFTVQLSYLYMTTGKTISLTRQTFVGKVMSLLFNMLSRLVITFLQRISIHTEETRIERDTCTPMFIAALFIIARTWKQPRCLSADDWIRKLWYIIHNGVLLSH